MKLFRDSNLSKEYSATGALAMPQDPTKPPRARETTYEPEAGPTVTAGQALGNSAMQVAGALGTQSGTPETPDMMRQPLVPEVMPPETAAGPLATPPKANAWVNPFVMAAGTMAAHFAQTPGQLAAGTFLARHGQEQIAKEDKEAKSTAAVAAALSGKPMAEGMDSDTYIKALGMKHEEMKIAEEQKRTKALVAASDIDTATKEVQLKYMKQMPPMTMLGPNGEQVTLPPDKAMSALLQLEQIRIDDYTATGKINLINQQIKNMQAEEYWLNKKQKVVYNGIEYEVPAIEAFKQLMHIEYGLINARAHVEAAGMNKEAALTAATAEKERAREMKVVDNMFDSFSQLNKNTQMVQKIDANGKPQWVPASVQSANTQAMRTTAIASALNVYHNMPENKTARGAANAMLEGIGATKEEQAQVARSMGLVGPNTTPAAPPAAGGGIKNSNAVMPPKMPDRPLVAPPIAPQSGSIINPSLNADILEPFDKLGQGVIDAGRGGWNASTALGQGMWDYGTFRRQRSDYNALGEALRSNRERR